MTVTDGIDVFEASKGSCGIVDSNMYICRMAIALTL